MRPTLPLLLLLGACTASDTDTDTDGQVHDGDHDGDGWVASEDCNDGDDGVHPGADEVCNGVDDDCDGNTDGDAVDATAWFPDVDEDGFGDPDGAITACDAPAGYVSDGQDCDDDAASIHPGAEEHCDGADEDCDGEADEDSTDAPTWYADVDGDTWGDSTSTVDACDAPGDHVDRGGDCDDNDASVHPEATEVPYDGVDQDCSGSDLCDVDGDGVDHPDCGGTDCDDTLAAVHPGATELHNQLDDDCDDVCDEGFIGAGDLIITEVQLGIPALADSQYLEVYNPNAFDVAICGGWTLSGASGDHDILDDPWLIPAGDHAVLASSDVSADNGGVPDVAYAWGAGWSLAATDTVALEHDGALVDQVAWDTSTYPWSYSYTAGWSFQLASDHYDATQNNDPYRWCASTAHYGGSGGRGTPSGWNDVCYAGS